MLRISFLVLLMTLLLEGSAPALASPPSPSPLRVVEVGAEDGWYPYGGVVDGKSAGLGVDLVRAAFAAVGVEVRFRSMPYARCLRLAVDGGLVACNEPARTAETESLLQWPDQPLFTARSLIYARAPSTEAGLRARDLEGRRVLVTHGFEYGSEFDANPLPIRVVATREVSVFRMLLAGRAPYALAYEKVAHHLWQQHPSEFAGKFVAVGQIDETQMYCAFSKRHPQAAEALKLFNAGWARISANGERKRIEARWP